MKTGLARLVRQVELAHEGAQSVEALARLVRSALQEHISDPGFILDCLERILLSAALENPSLPWDNPAIHADGWRNYKFRVFFWRPGYVNSPHRHNTWSVTGVLHEQCSVLIYRAVDESLPDSPRLVVDRQLTARAGEVGYLLPGCTHSVGNPGDTISATFHVFSDSAEVQRRRRDTIWYPNAEGALMDRPGFENHRFRTLRGAVAMLAGISDPRSMPLLERLLSLGGPRIKLACIRAMAARDPRGTASRYETFRSLLPPSAHEALDAAFAG